MPGLLRIIFFCSFVHVGVIFHHFDSFLSVFALFAAKKPHLACICHKSLYFLQFRLQSAPYFAFSHRHSLNSLHFSIFYHFCRILPNFLQISLNIPHFPGGASPIFPFSRWPTVCDARDSSATPATAPRQLRDSSATLRDVRDDPRQLPRRPRQLRDVRDIFRDVRDVPRQLPRRSATFRDVPRQLRDVRDNSATFRDARAL